MLISYIKVIDIIVLKVPPLIRGRRQGSEIFESLRKSSGNILIRS